MSLAGERRLLPYLDSRQSLWCLIAPYVPIALKLYVSEGHSANNCTHPNLKIFSRKIWPLCMQNLVQGILWLDVLASGVSSHRNADFWSSVLFAAKMPTRWKNYNFHFSTFHVAIDGVRAISSLFGSCGHCLALFTVCTICAVTRSCTVMGWLVGLFWHGKWAKRTMSNHLNKASTTQWRARNIGFEYELEDWDLFSL